MKRLKAPVLLNDANLKQLFHLLSLKLPKFDQDLVLFAIRAAQIASKKNSDHSIPTITEWLSSVSLQSAKIDYNHMRCVLGIWDLKNQRIYAAPGSTVPNEKQLRLAHSKGGKGANQLEPGFYQDFIKGEHLQGKARGHSALRQSASRFYRRPVNSWRITKNAPLFWGNPHDNLHCAWNLDPEQTGFSSAGCLVVAGWPACPRIEKQTENQGYWKEYHSRVYQSSQSRYPLLLLDYNILLKAFVQKHPQIVFGSSGEVVRKVQTKLKKLGLYLGALNGHMDTRTYRSYVNA